jgi:cysteine desulfurase
MSINSLLNELFNADKPLINIMEQIYLDHNATTPIDSRVFEMMEPLFSSKFGNAASSSHQYGHDAKRLVERSRMQLANGLGCKSNEVIFTSGATEAINMAIKGIVSATHKEKKHIVTIKTEHKAVLDSCDHVVKNGVEVDYLSVDGSGQVSISDIKAAIRPETILVIVMHGNNEIGTIHPIMEIGYLCKEYGVPLLVDAAQTLGKIAVNVKESGISMLVGSAHKIYGPKGSGFLFKESAVRIDPLIHGGGHEMGLRSGSHNVPGIVGLAVAYRLMLEHQGYENNKLKEYAQSFLKKIKDSEIDFSINGPVNNRLPGNLNICLKGVDADWLTTMIPNIAIARGSACTSETIQPSHVLRSISLSDDDANSSIRVSFGRFTTENEIEKAANMIIEQSKIYLSKKEVLAI